MNRVIRAAVLLAGAAFVPNWPAQADVIVDNHLSGTGDNVVFNSLSGSLATALLNGPRLDVVEFRDSDWQHSFRCR